MTTSPSSERPANRLAREKSPYLLQHAHNPVDWYPWGEAAFERARREDRPIFLSIGYSTCHWCHVMERESFENADVAELLNAHFVPVKVDREERPDVDRVHMTAMQAMGAGGGWPLNVFLTPSLKPFWGGTYFPPVTRGGRIGMTELLPRIRAAWLDQREQIESSGERVLELLGSLAEPSSADAPSAESLFEGCARWLERSFDEVEGGFGNAPKFPSTVNLAFLLRWWARDPDSRADALHMVRRQLDAMQAGGIHDHLGGGFHRYATDREWLVPHFEKMLYDQALIADAYLEGHLATGDPAWAETARGIFAYVARELTSPEGAFRSAEDADSEGEEGRFYVWTPAELAAALGDDDAARFAHAYGVTPQGNFEHGRSILHRVHDDAGVAKRFGGTPDEAARRLADARATLLAIRATRVRPHLDDKVIASWNGLMIAAFAHGARTLGDPALATAAARAADFVWGTLWDPAARTMRRRWRAGEVAGPGQLDDHADMARGCLALFAATHEPRWLERAATLAEAMIEHFADEASGAFFESPAGDPSVRVRMLDGFDGAELAGNSVALDVLLRLAALLDRPAWRERAERALHYWRRRLAGAPWAMPMLLAALDRAESPPGHVVIAGEPGADDTRAMLAAAGRAFRPHDDLVLVTEATRPALAALVPFTAALRPTGTRATAWICVNFACRQPVTDAAAFAAALAAPPEEIR